MQKLTDPAKIKEYVISTIKTGNKDRIQKVLARYFSVMGKKKDIVETAREIFGSK